MRIFLNCIIGICWLHFSSTISIANTASSGDVDSLIQRHIEASGGYDILMQIQSISRYGKIDFYDKNKVKTSYCYHTDIVYPTKLREQIVGQKILHDRGTDGVFYWLWTGKQYEFTEDPQIETSISDTAQQANRDMLWVAKESSNYALTAVPVWAPNRSQCIKQIEARDSIKRMYCFDNSTGLLDAVGSDEEYRLLSKWNPVGNIKIPFQLTHYQKGHIIYVVKLDHADLDKTISEELFSKPDLPELVCPVNKY